MGGGGLRVSGCRPGNATVLPARNKAPLILHFLNGKIGDGDSVNNVNRLRGSKVISSTSLNAR
jgi:hypothetical protein